MENYVSYSQLNILTLVEWAKLDIFLILHEISKPISGKNKKNTLKGRLLIFLLSMLSVKILKWLNINPFSYYKRLTLTVITFKRLTLITTNETPNLPNLTKAFRRACRGIQSKPRSAVFDQGLHCLIFSEQLLGTSTSNKIQLTHYANTPIQIH